MLAGTLDARPDERGRCESAIETGLLIGCSGQVPAAHGGPHTVWVRAEESGGARDPGGRRRRAVELREGSGVALPLARRALGLLRGALGADAAVTLHRSALFLLVFLLIHMLGNLWIFSGPDAFNCYGHLLHINPLLKLVEGYLLLAGVAHAAAPPRSLAQAPLPLRRRGGVGGQARELALVVVLGFVVVHLKQFKFGPHYGTKPERAGAAPPVPRSIPRGSRDARSLSSSLASLSLASLSRASSLARARASARAPPLPPFSRAGTRSARACGSRSTPSRRAPSCATSTG